MFARKGVEKYDPYSDRRIWDVVQKLRSEILKEVLSQKDLKILNGRCFRNQIPRKTARIFAFGSRRRELSMPSGSRVSF
jgi:hypothetical protein